MKSNEVYRENSSHKEERHGHIMPGQSTNEKVLGWFSYCWKWKGSLVLAVVIGIAFGVFNLINNQQVYQTNLLATSNYLSSSQIQSIIEGVQEHINNGDFDIVAKKFSMTPEQVSKIKLLHCQIATRNSDKNLFTLRMNISSNVDYVIYQAQIFNYLENLEYVKNKVLREQELTKNILISIDDMYNKLQKMEGLVNNNILTIDEPVDVNRQNAVNEAVVGLTNIVDHKLALQQRKFELENKLASSNNFEIIQGFEKYNKPLQKGYVSLFLPPVILALIAWGVLTWLFELRNEVKRRVRLKSIG